MTALRAGRRFGFDELVHMHKFYLSPEETHLLLTIAQGATLKVHRTMDGAKEYRVHPLRGTAHAVPAPVVTALDKRGFIDSNMKFPAATFILTERGRAAVAALAPHIQLPLASCKYAQSTGDE